MLMRLLALIALLPFAVTLLVGIGIFIYTRMRARGNGQEKDPPIESSFVDDDPPADP